jgi:hypothetical protein
MKFWADGQQPFPYRVMEELPVNRPQPQSDWAFNWTSSDRKRGVTGNVDPRLHFEWISFLKGYLCGQTDTAKQDLEARIRTQSIKQQVRLEGQGKA